MSKSNDQLLRYHRDAERCFVENIDELAYPDICTVMARDGFAAGEITVTAPNESDYRLPDYFAKTMAPAQLFELRQLMGRLWRHREALVGLSLHETQTLYNGDAETLLLQDDFAAWGEEYLLGRLRRPSRKDRGDCLRTWERIYEEFFDWLGRLSETASWGHSVVLTAVNQHLAWVLYQHTLAPLVFLLADGGHHILSNQPSHHNFLNQYLEVIEHHKVNSLASLATDFSDLSVDVMPAQPLTELCHIASDLIEFRGRLLRNYDPRTCITPIADVFVGWAWVLHHQAGIIHIGISREAVQAQIESHQPGIAVCIGLDGQLMNLIAPYQRYVGEDVIRWTLGILRPLHEKMFTEWERIGPLEDLKDADGESAELEAIAIACEVLVQEDVVECQVDETLGRVRVPPVRTTQLLNTLEQHFGCQIRRGKGSEITVFRPGGHIYTLPAHKRNTHYPSWMIRLLLKRVGIAPIDFATKICKRVQRY